MIKRFDSIGRALKKQKKGHVPVLENAIHTQIAAYLNTVIKRPSRWWTIEVSNQSSGKAAMLRQMALKRKGVVTGTPDIMIMHRKPYHAIFLPDGTGIGGRELQLIFLEVKIPGGKLTEKQEALHQELKEDGHIVEVVHSVDETKFILEKLGII